MSNTKKLKIEVVDCHIKGIVPLMVQNAQLADPMNPIVREIKKHTGKHVSKKTDEDHMVIQKLHFHGALYLNEKGHPILPGLGIKAFLVSAAKAYRKGKLVKAAVFCEEDPEIIYEGPKQWEELYEDKRFVDTRPVKIKGSVIMRTRPIFPVWELKFKLHINTSVINPTSVINMMHDGGYIVGMFEHRPEYGRFQVISPESTQ